MAGNPRHRKALLTGRALFRHVQRPGRTGLLRVKATVEGGAWLLSMPPTNGSGDLASTLGTDALARCDASLAGFGEGDEVPFTLAGWARGTEAWA
jgi:molybdopterin biosynthesis enzyme